MLAIHRIYRLFQNQFRPRRMRRFAARFGVTDASHILDIGGSRLNWTYLRVSPLVTIGNIAGENRTDGRFQFKRMDGCSLPYNENSFRVVFSNSVIEHVGSPEQQRAFADEVRRVGRGYYVQTPNRWFPIEPHFLAPFIHFLPRRLYRFLFPAFSPWYWITELDATSRDALFNETQLLNKRQMRELFPDATIESERFLGLTKSLIAVKTPD